jgi:hypothetical protein
MKITEQDKKRFFAKVKVNEKTGCHEWQGYLSRGYGKIRIEHKKTQVNRVAYQIAFGEFNEALCVCHKCDNPCCVNPEHLFLGTRSDNMLDMVSKKRGILPDNAGEKHGMSKLTKEQVLEIRASKHTQSTLAKKFGVHQQHISRIINRQTWKHIPEVTE